MGQNRKNGIVRSHIKKADDSWNREADFSGVKEVHLKFFVHDEEGQIPANCPRVQPDWRDMEKRALQHELSRGDQFIKNVTSVTPSGLGRKLVEAGFFFSKFSHHVKDTLHQTDRKVVVECVFSQKPDGDPMKWRDVLLGWYLSTIWRVHAYKNPGGIMTINLVHPARGRMRAERVFCVQDDTISIVSVRP
jgi:hypothetical protein